MKSSLSMPGHLKQWKTKNITWKIKLNKIEKDKFATSCHRQQFFVIYLFINFNHFEISKKVIKLNLDVITFVQIGKKMRHSE